MTFRVNVNTSICNVTFRTRKTIPKICMAPQESQKIPTVKKEKEPLASCPTWGRDKATARTDRHSKDRVDRLSHF